MGIFSFLGSLISPVSNAVGKYQDRKKTEVETKHAHEMAVLSQFAAEFGHSRTWFDSLIDGYNRLPRPVIVSLLGYYLYLSWGDPEQFAQINFGLATVPEEMWWLLGTVVTFFFGAREFSHIRKGSGFKQAAAAAIDLAKSQVRPLSPLEWLRNTYPDVQVKDGVVLDGLNVDKMAPSISAMRNLCHSKGVPCVITSGLDGKHGKHSLHYAGLALDFRSRQLNDQDKPTVSNALQHALGPDYDVVLEPDHIHVEYDPS